VVSVLRDSISRDKDYPESLDEFHATWPYDLLANRCGSEQRTKEMITLRIDILPT
jgi:hypothetical protein